MWRRELCSLRLPLLYGRPPTHLETVGGVLIKDLLALKDAVPLKKFCLLEEENFA